jgi:hypothetical protein
MTIQRSHSPHADPAQRAQASEPSRPAKPVEPPPAEHVDRFRAAMQQARGGGQEHQAAVDAAAEARLAGAEGDTGAEQRHPLRVDAADERGARSHDDGGQAGAALPPAEYAAMLQAQASLRDGGMAAQAAPPTANAHAFFDLVERHVRQMAVGAPGHAGEDGQVLLRMSDATLPGTDLMLSKGPEGWVLRADVRSRTSYDAIREAAPELARRFADRNLGQLVVDPHFNG